MHSNQAPRRLRRMTPYLITVGLGLSVTAHAAEPEFSDDKRSEIPAPSIDTDGDGIVDAWDRSGDGRPDVWDSNSDDQPDLLDGKPD